MKARIMDTTWVYKEKDPDAQAVASFQAGEEVELGEAVQEGDQEWVPVAWGEGQNGYIRGDTEVFVIRNARINQKLADLYSAPGKENRVIDVLAKGERVEMLGILDLDDGRWVRVRTSQGTEGYLPGSTRINLEQLPVKQDMQRELRGWGVGLIIMGAISLAFSQYLNAIWGVVLTALGVAVLVIRHRAMFLAIGAALLAAGVLNLTTRGLSPWAFLAVLQAYWGVQQMRKFWTYAPLPE